MTITIKHLTPADTSGVIELIGSLHDWFDEDARERAIPIDLRFQDGFVADDGKRIVGFITLYVAEGRVNIGWMGVHADFHRQGIGGDLLEAAESYCRERGIAVLATYTLGEAVEYEPYDATRAFYFAHRFSIYQRSQTDNPACPEEIKLKKLVAL